MTQNYLRALYVIIILIYNADGVCLVFSDNMSIIIYVMTYE